MPVIYKNGQAYGSDEWRSDINTFRSQMDEVIGITKTYTLSPSEWDADNIYTIEDGLITVGTNESTQIISYPSEEYSDELYNTLVAANIRVFSVTTGQLKLKAMGGKPLVQLQILITYRQGATPITLTMDSVPTNGSHNPITSDGVYEALNNVYSGGRYYWAGDDIGYDSTAYNSSISLNVNTVAGIATLRLYGQAAKAINSGTNCTIATIPPNVKAIVGQHYVRGVGASTAANTIVIVTFNTWEDSSYVEITPRGNISSGNSIVATLTWPI